MFLLEKLIFSQLVKKYPDFMEPEDTLSCSQKFATGHYNLNQKNPLHTLRPYISQIHFNIIFLCTFNSISVIVHWCFQARILYSFHLSPCMLHVAVYFILFCLFQAVTNKWMEVFNCWTLNQFPCRLCNYCFVKCKKINIYAHTCACNFKWWAEQ
jgi:hypothetical protein